MRYPDGQLGRLVTGYALARQILMDPSFVRSHANPFPGAQEEVLDPPPPGLIVMTDPPEHTRWRKMLSGDWPLKKVRCARGARLVDGGSG